ncbi:MAG TPA: metal ABC transporter ATP-binding protein [Ruminiclostridium sp.]|nr:metal ABC transporter ATP-binding protein [Ruminiclostridium sp.]
MIKIENLRYSYTGAPPFILNDLSLEIKKGEYVSVLGDNGSGKSTLIKLILGLLRPVSGRIINSAVNTGYVAQKSDWFNPQFPITVHEVLNCARRVLKVKDKSAVQNSLCRVQMEQFANELIGTLSGGQLQRVLIARALIGNPDLLVLDEPSTGIDIKSQHEIYTLIKKLNREDGITVVSVEHNLDAAVKNSSLIYHISEGHAHVCSPQSYADEFLKGGNE